MMYMWYINFNLYQEDLKDTERLAKCEIFEKNQLPELNWQKS